MQLCNPLIRTSPFSTAGGAVEQIISETNRRVFLTLEAVSAAAFRVYLGRPPPVIIPINQTRISDSYLVDSFAASPINRHYTAHRYGPVLSLPLFIDGAAVVSGRWYEVTSNSVADVGFSGYDDCKLYEVNMRESRISLTSTPQLLFSANSCRVAFGFNLASEAFQARIFRAGPADDDELVQITQANELLLKREDYGNQITDYLYWQLDPAGVERAFAFEVLRLR